MINFLETLYQYATGYIYLWTLPDKKTYWFPVSDLSKVASRALSLSNAGENVYFGVGLTANKKTTTQRAESPDVTCIPGLWIDLDTKDDKHPNNPDMDTLVEFINNFYAKPSILVKSGNGLHAYWLFKEPLTLDTPEEKLQARTLLAGFQEAIKQLGKSKGWKFDSTQDLARVLRLPGTKNYKRDPLPVEVIQSNDIRYNIDDLDQYTVDVTFETDSRQAQFRRLPSDGPATLIMDNCAYCQQLRNPAGLTEPEIFAMITNLSRGVDGFELIHDLIKPYLGDKYVFEKTEKKIQHAFYDNKPIGCTHIQNVIGFKGCPAGGCGIKAPVGWATAKKKRKKTSDPVTEPEWVPMEKLTDTGNAERFARMFAGQLKYSAHFGKWLIWDGVRWKIDETGAVMAYAVKCIRSLYHDAAEIDNHDIRKAVTDHARKSEALARLNAMISLSQHMLSVRIDELDNNEWLLNVNNGVLDLKTGQLIEHTPENMITKLAPVTYSAGADCPVFKQFISSVFCDNQNIIQFVQRLLGYCLTGDTREQQFSIAWGSGRNGKGTLLNLVLDMLGDYAQTTEASTLMAKKSEGIANDIARMRGARYVIASEVGQGKRFNEALIKQMTGQDKLAARFLYQETFEFMPQFKLILLTNDKPSARGEDQALWDRIQLVPFTQRFVGEKQDKTLPYKLRSESEKSGILNWLIEGCLEWQRIGLKPPDEVLQATNEYRSENDNIQNWIDDCCVVDEYKVASSGMLYRSFEEWSKNMGEKYITNAKNFSKLLVSKGFFAFKGTGGARKMRGIGLIDENHSELPLKPADTRTQGNSDVEPF